MPRRRAAAPFTLGVVLLGLAATAGRAHAATCTRDAGGNAIVTAAAGVYTSVGFMGGTPTINGVACGAGAAPTIVITGTGGNDRVMITSQVPTAQRITLDLGAGKDNLAVDGTSGNDTIGCPTATSIDRSGDGTGDVVVTGAAIESITLSGLGGSDTISCALLPTKLMLSGGPGDDVLRGGALVDSLSGGDGDDELYGADGNDSLTGGPGEDVEYGEGGNDTFQEGKVPGDFDLLIGGDGKDTVSYAARTVGIIASPLGAVPGTEDWIETDIEAVVGSHAADELDFSHGIAAVTLTGKEGDDWLLGAGGNDKLYGGPDNDVLLGGGGNDQLYGEAGDDYLEGNGGKDTYFGDIGDDEINAPADGVTMERVDCGAGTDTYTANLEDTFTGCETAAALARVADDGEAHAEPADEAGGCTTSRGGAGSLAMIGLVAAALAGTRRRRRQRR